MVRQLLLEGALIAAAAGGVGLAGTVWALALLRAAPPANLPRLGDVRLDGTVLAFALLVSAATVGGCASS